MAEIKGEFVILDEVKGAIRGDPKQWTELVINNTYKFESGLDEVKEDQKLTDWFFLFTAKSNKDKYKVDNITKEMLEEMQNVLLFLNTILSPDKSISMKI